MTDECVRDMAVQAHQKAMTIFLNHKYAVPEDPFGMVTASAVTSRASDDDGKPIWDMDLDIALAMSNPRVPKTYALIKDDGLKLGVSIGAMIVDWDFKDEKEGWWGGLIIKKVDLLEASIVGIPANQRSWVQNAVMALKAWTRSEKSMDADDTIEQPPVTILPKEAPAAATPPVQEGPTLQAGETGTVTGDGTGEALPPADNDEGGTDLEAAGTPATPGNVEGDGSAAAETPEKPVEASTDPEKAAAAQSEPPTANQSPEGLTLIEATVTTLEAAITEIATLQGRVSSLTDENAALRKERDAATQLAEAASELIEKIATTPLGRKTAVREETNDFRSLVAKVYGPEIAAVMPTETTH